jgi:hypothetical protein
MNSLQRRIIPMIINQRIDKRDTVKNQLQKRYSSMKHKKGDIVMLKNYLNSELSKFKRRFKDHLSLMQLKWKQMKLF